MKNIVKLFGIIALVALIGFSMVACGGDDGGGGGGGGGGGSGNGSLTITGLTAYNGKYVGGSCVKSADNIIMAGGQYNNGTLTGGEIKDGTVTLKVWKSDGMNVTNYSGNDKSVTFYLSFMDKATDSIGIGTSSRGEVTVDFTNGVASGAFQPF